MQKITMALLTAAFGLLLLGGCSVNPIDSHFPTGSLSHADGAGSGGGGGDGGGGY